MSYPKVAVVILNYNGKHWLEKFLPDVIGHNTYPNSEIIIADNASTDNSVEYIRTQFSQIRFIQNPENNGYAGGYNEALRQIDADYYVLLNSDVEVTQNWIENIVTYMESDKLIAAAQPKILSFTERTKFEYAGAAGGFLDKYGYPFCRGRIFDTCEEDTGQYNTNSEIFWASGACLFIKADLFHKAGGLDADFFAHMEEIDLCWRLKNLGYKIGYCAESVVYHVGGGTLDKSNPKKLFLNFRNNRAMIYKNANFLNILYIEIVRDFLDLAAVLVAVLKGNLPEAKAVTRGVWHYFKSIGHILHSKRKEINHQKKIHPGNPNKTGIYRSSIVFTYYIRKIKVFSKLRVSKFSI
jgi:hypothetical protein